MADILHRVIVEMVQGGALSASSFAASAGKLDQMERASGRISQNFVNMGSQLADAFTGAVEKVGALGVGLAALGAGAGLAAIKYGVVNLNSELEKTTISLGTIFNANGLSNGMASGMKDAAVVMKQMRQDAAALPGETSDLVGIFRSVASPGAQAGANIGRIEQLSAHLMAAGSVSGLDMGTVGREAAGLLSGRAGSHNILGSQLFGLNGDKAEAFNQSSQGDRLKILETKLQAFGQAADYFNTSFEAGVSTLKDNVKGFLRDSTEPLFQGVKRTLSAMNQWFTDNQTKIEAWSGLIGDRLSAAWTLGTNKILEWWPAISKFAEDAYGALKSIWERLGPSIIAVGGQLKQALGDGSALSKIESVLKLYGAVKMGQPLLGAASSIGSAASGLVSGAASGEGMLGAAGLGTLGLPELGIAAAIALPLILAGAGAFDVLSDSTNKYHTVATQAADQIKGSTTESMASLTVAGSEMVAVFKPLADLMGTEFIIQMAGATTILRAYTDSLAWQAQKVHELMVKLHLADPDVDTRGPKSEAYDFDNQKMMHPLRQLTEESTRRGANPLAGGGAGGGHITNVSINVSSNADPSRVARLVFNEVKQLARFPGQSPGAPNYSSAR